MSETDKKEVKQTRQKRVPFGTKALKLSVNKEVEGYHLHWFNDEPGRIYKAEMAGYTFVTPEEVGLEARDGNQVKVYSGLQKDRITPMYSYLMKIPLEFYEEDNKAKGQVQDTIDAAIRGGTLEQRAGDGRYIPKSGIKYST